jgi:hypothetical protein
MSRIYLSYDSEQQLLLRPDLRKWLPEGHLALGHRFALVR